MKPRETLLCKNTDAFWQIVKVQLSATVEDVSGINSHAVIAYLNGWGFVIWFVARSQVSPTKTHYVAKAGP